MTTPFYTQSSPLLSSVDANTKMPPSFTVDESKPQKRCGHSECKRKLLLTDLTCKCGQKFCMSHRMPEAHTCAHDYKAEARANLNKQLVGCVAEKLERA